MSSRLVVEVTRTSLRVALAESRRGKMRLHALTSEPLGPQDEPGNVLQTFLKTAKTTPTQVVGVVPREQVIVRTVKFPATDSAELAQMVELYAKAQLPYPREQAVMDFMVVDQRQGFSTVALVACQREVIDRPIAMLRAAGLSPNVMTVSSWGVLGWFRHSLRRMTAASHASPAMVEPTLVINVDECRVDFVLIAEGRLLSSRSVGQGVGDWESPGQGAELLMVEVERSRAAIRKELPGVEIRSVVLTGIGPLGEWKEQLAQQLGVPINLVDPMQPVEPPLPSMGVSASAVVVAGLVSSELDEGLLNLNPPELRGQAHQRRQVRELVRVSVLGYLVLLLGASGLWLQDYRQRKVADQLDTLVGTMAPTARRLQEKTRALHLIKSVLEDRRRLAQVLSDVFEKTPSDIVLEALTFERARRSLSLKGHAASNQAVLEYLKLLERLKGVAQVELKYSAARTSQRGERMSFELVLHQG